MESAIAQDGTRSDVGSQLRNTTREITNKAPVAQRLERATHNGGVIGSIPIGRTKSNKSFCSSIG